MLIKICGITQQAALDAMGQGPYRADMCGFIFVPTSPRFIPVEAAAALQSHNLLRVGVFVEDNIDRIQHAIRIAKLDAVQLHGNQSTDTARRLMRLPSGTATHKPVQIIRTLWPALYATRDDLETALHEKSETSHLFLLDAGTQGGGSGTSLCWHTLQGLHSPHPWLLAGGLTATNARTALHQCTPQGLDFNSGLENPNGQKDVHKIEAVLRALRGTHHE